MELWLRSPRPEVRPVGEEVRARKRGFLARTRWRATVRGPWRGLEDVEFATLEWVWWFNHHRRLEPLGYLPPAEYEEAFYRREETQHHLPALTN
jgi:transposase InsO family protein